jgi:hypothetical protein
MRQLAFGCILAVTVGAVAFSCGSDVENEDGSGGSNEGGMGGDPVTTTSTGSQGGNTMMGCADMQFPNKCEEACCKVQVTCGLTGACDLAFAQLGIACGDPEAECVGEIILDPDTKCEDLPALATGTAPQELQNGLLSCLSDDPCLQCGIDNCATQAFDCQNVTECQSFITCVTDNSCNTATCVDSCASDNASTETDALVSCIATNCPTECYQGGGGGAGGTGGGGGAGGTGGSGGSGGN